MAQLLIALLFMFLVTFILTRGIGQSFVADDVPANEVLRFLEEKHPG